MRPSNSKIKTTILHADEEVRLGATLFFAGSLSQDETIMPCVIRAVERFGKGKAFLLLRAAEPLPQSPATIRWLVKELRKEYRVEDLGDDNYRFAVAMILCAARPELLLASHDEILGLAMFPVELRKTLDDRMEMLSWQWDQAWSTLEELAAQFARRGRWTWNEFRYGGRLVECLARHRSAKAGEVADWLQRHREGRMEGAAAWHAPFIVRLAGRMRLEVVVPHLLELLSHEEPRIRDESISALIQIDGESAPAEIASLWSRANPRFRAAASEVLENIHSDSVVATCLRLFEAEEELDAKILLGHAVLSQFVDEGIEPVRQLILDRGVASPLCARSLCNHLVIACTITNKMIPEFDQWRRAAMATDWGRGDVPRHRLADDFRSDEPVPDRPSNVVSWRLR